MLCHKAKKYKFHIHQSSYLLYSENNGPNSSLPSLSYFQNLKWRLFRYGFGCNEFFIFTDSGHLKVHYDTVKNQSNWKEKKYIQKKKIL